MAFNIDNTTKNDVLTAIRDRVANGTLEIGTSGMSTVVATFGLSASGGSIASQVWTLEFDASPVQAGASGTVAAAQIKDSGGTVRVSGLTVGTSSADIVLDGLAVNSGQDVALTSATVTHG